MTAPSPGGVQRYDIGVAGDMVGRDDGDWVRYGDIAGVEKEMEKATALNEKLAAIHYAAFALATFGRPKEGSDKYKAAWDAMWALMQRGPYESLSEALRGAAGEV